MLIVVVSSALFYVIFIKLLTAMTFSVYSLGLLILILGLINFKSAVKDRYLIQHLKF